MPERAWRRQQPTARWWPGADWMICARSPRRRRQPSAAPIHRSAA